MRTHGLAARPFSIGLAALLVAAPLFAGNQKSDEAKHPLPYTLPATLEQLRFIVHARTQGGQVLDLVTDTAGGTNISTIGADKLGWKYTAPKDPRVEAAGSARWPAFAGAWIPPPAPDAHGAVDMPILVPPRGVVLDGMLGVRWFAGRTWEWNYPAGTLRLLPAGALPEVDASHVLAMAFKGGTSGQATSFARIPARVDGVELQFLFHTGVTFRPSPTAATAMGDPSISQRAGSFIALGVMKGWRERHPDWPFVARGDSGAPMIQVPDVEIAGWHTGPVWFAARADDAFHQYLDGVTDRPVDGALGGNAYATFRITADYPSARLAFEQLAPPPVAKTSGD
jgi:hypothetical protein